MDSHKTETAGSPLKYIFGVCFIFFKFKPFNSLTTLSEMHTGGAGSILFCQQGHSDTSGGAGSPGCIPDLEKPPSVCLWWWQ